MQEQWARDAYLDCRTSRLEAEFASIEIGQRRNHALVEAIGGLRKLEEKASEQEIVVNVLLNDVRNTPSQKAIWRGLGNAWRSSSRLPSEASSPTESRYSRRTSSRRPGAIARRPAFV